MVGIRLVGAACVVGMTCVAGGAWAQSVPGPADLDAIQRQQQQILRDQEERQRLLEEERRSRTRTAPKPRPEEAAPSGQQGDARCFEVARITLEGISETSLGDVSDLLAANSGRCLGLAEIDALVRALTNRYVELGYSTTRVYIPQQDLGSGVLRLIVREGRVETLKLDEPGPHGGRLATAFPGVEGEVLNLRDIEQGLDQINRLRANDASMEITPGSTPGASTVTIRNRRQARWFAAAGVDNSGSKSSGEHQAYSQLEMDDAVGLNDLWSLDARRSLDDESGIRKSESLSGFVSVPFGYWTASLSASWFDYRSPVTGSVQTFETSGATRTWKARLERVVHRDAVSKTSVSGAFALKDTFNYVEDTRLDASSRRLAIATVDVAHSRRILGGALSLGLAHDAGLHTMGAESDAGRDPDAPEAQFEKWTADASYWHPLPAPEGYALSWASAARGQWTPDTLHSTERISIGSQYSVRGFKEQSASGDVGGYLRNDLSLTLPASGDADFDRLFGRISLGLGYDVGAIRRDRADAYERGRLSGAALSVSSGGRIPIRAVWARPISAPSFIARDDNVFYVSMGVSF